MSTDSRPQEVTFQEPSNGSQNEDSSQGSEYPEQKHAGKVGLGPHYKQDDGPPGISEKFTGIKDEIKGKILRNSQMVEKGHDRRTGVLKEKMKEEKERQNPFGSNAPVVEDQKEGDADDENQEPRNTRTRTAAIEHHGESKPLHPDHRNESAVHKSIADRYEEGGRDVI